MKKILFYILLFPLWFFILTGSASAADKAVVRAVLFYSQSCGHCHLVITEVLPPLINQYGEQLQIIGVDIGSEGGQALFMGALQKFELDRGGVPFLVIGDTYLVGSVDIPEKFPVLVKEYMEQGGVDWPDLPGMAEALQAATGGVSSTATAAVVAATPEPEATLALETTPLPAIIQDEIPHTAPPSLGEKLARDPEGNMLSIIVLIVMVTTALWVGLNHRRLLNITLPETWKWAIPLLCAIGLAIAGYQCYVEITNVEAVCGPVGDCNTVQQSKYATLFGVLPVGLLGIAGYIAILIAWVIIYYGKSEWKPLANKALIVMTTFGLLFSIYLTFLEPFVIGATCAWCLTSSLIMTALFLLSLLPIKSLAPVAVQKHKYIKRAHSQSKLKSQKS